MNKLFKSLLAVTMIAYPMTANATVKKETVFSTLNTNGSIKESMVNNYICPLNVTEYEDQTRLTEIINLSGTETFTQDDKTITWKTEGHDIYYTGKTNEEMPINISIKYYLDGVEHDASEIKGNKGHVDIKITLENKMANRVKVNGRYEILYTPFVVMAGTIMSPNNTNIKASNGRVVNTGAKSIVTSIASPGLYKSLNMSQLSNLDEITISFDTEKFEMSNIYIIATPKLLEENDIKLFKDLDGITDSIKTLQDSMNKIENGSNKLKQGLDELSNGVNQLDNSLPTIDENNANLGNLNLLKNTNESTIATLDTTNESLTLQKSEVENKITLATQSKNNAESQLEAVKTNLLAATSIYNERNAQLTEVNNGIAQLENLSNLTTEQQTTLATLKQQQAQLNTIVPLLKNQKDALSGTKAALEGTIESINGTLTLLNTTKETLNKSIAANNNLVTLLTNNNKVVLSSIQTIDKMNNLKTAMDKLNTGVTQINTGMNDLNNGINKFNTQGIKKISEYANKVRNYSSKAEALVNLSKNYTGYSCDNASETIFVSKVDSIK